MMQGALRRRKNHTDNLVKVNLTNDLSTLV
jgi:hypothetical protein